MSDLWKDDIPQSQRHQVRHSDLSFFFFFPFSFSVDDSKWSVFGAHESLGSFLAFHFNTVPIGVKGAVVFPVFFLLLLVRSVSYRTSAPTEPYSNWTQCYTTSNSNQVTYYELQNTKHKVRIRTSEGLFSLLILPRVYTLNTSLLLSSWPLFPLFTICYCSRGYFFPASIVHTPHSTTIEPWWTHNIYPCKSAHPMTVPFFLSSISLSPCHSRISSFLTLPSLKPDSTAAHELGKVCAQRVRPCV